MELKNIGIVLSMIIGITIVGTITLELNQTQGSVDESVIDLDTVNALLESKEHVLVVDIRTAKQYQLGHLAGASHDVLDSTTMEKRVNTIQSKLPDVVARYSLVLVDNDGTKAKPMAQSMTEMGIQTFYLDGGMNDLSGNLVTSSQTVIDSKELMKRLESDEDLYLLDVRQPDELLESKIDGSVNVSLAEIFQPNGMNDIPTDKPVVVICGSGNRATIASYALVQEDIDFQVLEGGMTAWNAQIQDKINK